MTENLVPEQLRSLADRTIRLEDEKDALVADLKEIKGEAKALGYSVKAFSAAVKIARMTPEQRTEAEQYQMELELYVSAIVDGETE